MYNIKNMKKFSRYFLIIILLESFVWTTQVNAQTGSAILPNNGNSTIQTPSKQWGICTTTDLASGTQTVQKTPYLKENCLQQINSTTSATWVGYYYFLAPLPGVGTDDNHGSAGSGVMFDPTNNGKQTTSLGSYLNPMISAFIGICAILAFVMIVIGGIEYMTSELPGNKSDGKDRITNAIFGLLLALGAWAILNTINPDLLKSDISTPDAKVGVTVKDFAASPSTYIVPLGQTGKASGTNCDANAVAAANQAANAGLSNAQIQTLACIGGIESGCQSVQNYNWNNGSSAYGPFQITLQGNANCFENNVCQKAAGVSGPLNCASGFLNGNPKQGSSIAAQCMKAADDFTCSVSAAACLIKQSPNYSPWNANGNLSKCK
jgi:hypothetical protein